MTMPRAHYQAPAVRNQKPLPPAGLNLWLILPIVWLTVFFCGVAGIPFNAAGLVFAILARVAYDRGNLDKSAHRLRLGKVFTTIGMVFGGLNILVGLTAAVIGAGTEH